MASFFDKVVVGINKGVSTVSEGSKLIIEKANLNTQIKDLERDKARLLQNMGTLVYNLHVSGDIQIEQCLGICNEVKGFDEKILAIQQQLQSLEAAKAQPQPAPTYSTQTSVEDGVVCECGHANKAGAKFCAKCGSKLAQ